MQRVLTTLVCLSFVLVILSTNSSDAQDEPAKTALERQVETLLGDLRSYRFSSSPQDGLAEIIKEIVEMGEPAVPILIAELDKTDNVMMMRSLGFILRAMNDPRAVPALIRAIPKTLVPSLSDLGCRCDDEALLAFMQKHDLDKDNRDGRFGYGRPFREITGALRNITKTHQRDDEVNFVFLGGGERQQQIQRKLFHELAVRWQSWWEENWRDVVMDPAYKDVKLPEFKQQSSLASLSVANRIKVMNGMSGATVQPIEKSSDACFLDLDSGRRGSRPAEMFRDKEVTVAEQLKQRDPEVLSWAAEEGLDLMGFVYQPPGTDENHFAIKPLGMRVWRVDNHRWDSFDKEVASNESLKLGQPADGVLMAYDAKTKKYLPDEEATFIFETREGTTGLIQIMAEVTRVIGRDLTLEEARAAGGDDEKIGFYEGVKIRSKMIYEEQFDRP